MSPSNQQSISGRVALLALLSALSLVLFGSGRVALASEANTVGFITAMPTSGLTGNWVINGVAFVANGSTDFRQDKGAFAVGVCAEVQYEDAVQPFIATKIASKNADDCSVSGTPVASPSPSVTTSTTPSETATPEGTPEPGTEQEAVGLVEQMPTSGLVGTWVVGGVTYNAPAGAEFKQRNGPLVVGACVKLHYATNTTPFTVRELGTELAADCNGSAPTPDGTPDATPDATPNATPDDETEIYGRVTTLPAGLVGAWVVNGVTYDATANSEFNPDHGAFVVGGCVKIHLLTTTSPATIREIETEQAFRCNSSVGGSVEGELYGVIQSLPAGLVGNWNIGGMSFVTTASTQFSQVRSAFAVGVTVKVHFSVDSSGINQAREIEAKFANDDNGNDDDNNGSFEGAEGHAYAAIDSFPAALTGPWRIGGIDYTATSDTIFAQNNGAFAVGVKVKVEYHVDGSNNRVARSIESTNETGGVTEPASFIFFGFVNQLPPHDFVGACVVNSIDFLSSFTTQVAESNGVLGLGAYVGVEYITENGQNQVRAIETYVPPGAGANNAVGRIESTGGALTAAGVHATTWTVGGVNYTVTPATDLNDVRSGLEVGKTALVNSYTAPDGSQVATQIRGITIAATIHLPLVRR